jgi:hypothetical protein
VIDLVAGQTTVVIVFSVITGLALVITTVGFAWVFFAAFDDFERNVRDVQRFVELTEEARSLVPAGLPLFDREKAAATTASIGRFLAKKDEARRALWQPRSLAGPSGAHRRAPRELDPAFRDRGVLSGTARSSTPGNR